MASVARRTQWVTYQTDLFLDKNKDYVIAEHQALLSAASCSFVSGLFPPLAEESSKSSKFSSIGSRFKGVMEAIRINCAGYPSRKTLCEFLDRFSLLALDVLDGSSNEVIASEKVLEKVGLKGYQARTRIASTVKAIVDERIGNGEVSNKHGDFLQILLSANTLSDNEKLSFVDWFREMCGYRFVVL
ncbi:hypothetical protein Scep_029714 [Stephania cephalantha]|uniref:Uncharacterized protein n=1 Tax=Stephania cephalantha TaxID=152367 RepID=A0AAP0E607_9MAGN